MPTKRDILLPVLLTLILLVGAGMTAGYELPATASGATFQGLGFLDPGAPNPSSHAFGVSADGAVVVGYSRFNNSFYPFRWQNGVLQNLGSPTNQGSAANAASGDGSVVVGSYAFSAGRQAFRWQDGVMQGLGFLPGATYTDAHAVSADGSIVVGVGRTGSGTEAFLWQDGVMTGLGDLPGGRSESNAQNISADGSVIVGYSHSTNGTEAFRWQDGVMTALGDLPGGDFSSGATAVSADGSVIVGYGRSADGTEAFRWQDGVMTGLGDLPGGPFLSRAQAISADGQVVVGYSYEVAFGERAFIWTDESGMRNLKELLESEYGLNLGEWTLLRATGISGDGQTIVGSGVNPGGQNEAWYVNLSAPVFLTPSYNELVEPGAAYTVTWSAPGLESVDLYYTTDFLPDADNGNHVLIAEDVSAGGGLYAWAVPEALLSPHGRLLLRDHDDPAAYVYSDLFRVRPPDTLYRVVSDGQDFGYEAFEPGTHGWSFENTLGAFPEAYWSQERFDYQSGSDPYTLAPYPDATDIDHYYRGWVQSPGAPLPPRLSPTWPSWVEAFGTGVAYVDLVPGGESLYRQSATQRWDQHTTAQGGVCFGMATTALMAFGDAQQFGETFPQLGAVPELNAVPLSDAVRDATLRMHNYQWGQRYLTQWTNAGNVTPSDVFSAIETMLRSDVRSNDFVLTFYSNNDVGAHAVVPYHYENCLEADEDLKCIEVYDPNENRADLWLQIDLATNQWLFVANPNYQVQSTGLIMTEPIAHYFELALFPADDGGPAATLPDARPASEAPTGQSPQGMAVSGDSLELFVQGTEPVVTITDASGSSIGYTGGTLFNEIAGAEAIVPITGFPTPPVGYLLPTAAYTASIQAAAGEPVHAAFHDGASGPSTTYRRYDTLDGEHDTLAYAPSSGLTLYNEDTVEKAALVQNLVGDGNDERVLGAHALRLVPDSAVNVMVAGAAGSEGLVLKNHGAASTYALFLNRVRPGGGQIFYHANIFLAAGATHTVEPNWETLGDDPVSIDVDLDGDGVVDETILVDNEGGLMHALFLPFLGRQ